MFYNLIYSKRDVLNKCDVFLIEDTCNPAASTITTAYGSPKLDYRNNGKRVFGNTLVVLAIIKNYESKKLNVARNLAEYYKWIMNLGFRINDKFIYNQLATLENMKLFNIKPKTKYFNLVKYYVFEHHNENVKKKSISLFDDFIFNAHNEIF